MAFDFTAAMHALMSDIAATCDELRHVDMSRVAVAFSQAKNRRTQGTHARTRALRFRGGAQTVEVRGRRFVMPRVVVNGQEVLYAISYSLPRFLDLPFEEKLRVVVHEMYHIGPRFDGDLRRFAGGKPYHTGSKRNYDAAMSRIAQAYLAKTTRPELHAFLKGSFRELVEAHGAVVGVRLRGLRPRGVQSRWSFS